MHSVIMSSPPLLALFAAALVSVFLTGRGKRLAVLGWLAGMLATVHLILAALVLEAALQEIVTALTLLSAACLLGGRRREQP